MILGWRILIHVVCLAVISLIRGGIIAGHGEVESLERHHEDDIKKSVEFRK